MKIICTLFLLAATAMPSVTNGESWRPKERWRGFNLEGYGLKGTFSGRIDEQDMKWIRELGFNYVRLMFDHHFLMSDGDWAQPDPEKFTIVDNAIAMARRNGLHADICLSIPPGIDYKVTRSKAALFKDPKTGKALVDYWRLMAKRYRGISNDELTFNLFNEPNAEPQGDEYVRLIAACMKAIGEEDPERAAIADGLESGREPELGAIGIKNLMQSLHAYEPMCISHYEAEWISGSVGIPAWPPSPMLSPICGTGKPPTARSPIIIRKMPAGLFVIDVNLVNRRGEIYVRADGREIFRKFFVPQPDDGEWTNLVARTNGEWAGKPVKKIRIDLPACDRLEIGLGEGDWVDISRFGLKSGDKRAVIKPTYDFARSQLPRREVWFAGFDKEQSIALDEKGTLYNGVTYLQERTFDKWDNVLAAGQPVMVGEFGFYNKTPHAIGMRWLEDNLREWKKRDMGWALWNFRGPFGILDSGRKDVNYVDFHGHKLDREMYELLKRY